VVKITLDAETFKALASSTRLTVLRALDQRRKTLTELARDLDLNKATVHEHLQLLTAADLIRKRDDEGRKWIYYELSDKGRKVLHPERVAITLALAAAVFLAAVGAFYLSFASGGFFGAAPALNAAPAERTDLQASGPGILGVLALLLSLAFAGIALALRLYGQRRLDRFFEQLGTS